MKRKSILCVTLAAALAAGSLAGCGAPRFRKQHRFRRYHLGPGFR